MADRREWIARIKAESPPDLWSDVMERAGHPPVQEGERAWAGRPGTPRRAAFVTGAAAGILALTLVVVALRGAPPGDEPPAPTPLDSVHDRLERALSDLWIAEAHVDELRGELKAAQQELVDLRALVGPDPTDAQLVEIQRLQAQIQAWIESAQRYAREITLLRERVDRLRAARVGLFPPADASDHPDVATVTCDGDRLGGTHLSGPVVRAQPDGVHLRVVNRISNERVFLEIGRLDEAIPPGGTREIVMPLPTERDVEVMCTYLFPRSSWERPTHPLWIASATSEGPSASPTPPPVSHLDPLTLTASLDEPGVTWTEVASVPAGEAEGEIGIQPCFHCGDQQVPTAIAVDDDGGFWIADRYKRRVAHFDADGSFLEAFPVAAGPADVAFVDGRLYALLTEGGSSITALRSGGFAEPITVNHEGRRLHVQALIGGQDELLVLVSGAQRLLGGYWAFGTVDPETGQVTPSSGVRSDGETRVDFAPLLDDPPGNYQIRWYPATTGVVTAQDVRFQLVTGGHELRTTAGDTYLRISTQRGVATIVGLSDVRGIAGGLWYLEIVPESPSIVFERIAEAGLVGTANNRRYLTVGPDGEVYLMRLFEDGIRIYRR